VNVVITESKTSIKLVRHQRLISNLKQHCSSCISEDDWLHYTPFISCFSIEQLW